MKYRGIKIGRPGMKIGAIDIYPTSRPRRLRRWQAELAIPQPPNAVTAFTRWGIERKALRMHADWVLDRPDDPAGRNVGSSPSHSGSRKRPADPSGNGRTDS